MQLVKYLLLPVFAAMLLLTACAGSDTKESTGQYVDNSLITTKVKSLLVTKMGTTGASIKVKSYKRTVQLSGFVKDEVMVTQAEEIAASVKNVESVVNDIRVR